MDPTALLLVIAVIFTNLLSRFYGFWAIARLGTSWRRGLLFWPVILVQLLVPLPLPKEYPLLKWFLLSNTCLHVFKLIDYYHRYESLSEKDRSFKRFFHSFECLYTANIRKSFVKEDSPSVPARTDGPRKGFYQGLLYFVLGMAFLALNRHFGWWSLSPRVDYLTLGVEYYFLCVGLVNIGVGIHRMMGYRVEGFFLEPTRAGSPGEFWARWNVPVHEWLKYNVYKKLGGHRHPYRGLFTTFLASGMFHEYIISLASNTLNGFMVAYFMTQFLFVVLSVSLHHLLDRYLPIYSRVRLARPFVSVKRFLTVCCVLLPVPLFIHNFKKVFPLHTF